MNSTLNMNSTLKQMLFPLFIAAVSLSCSNQPENDHTTETLTRPGEIIEAPEDNVIRKGWVIKVKPEKLDFYKELHASPWEGVNKKLKECNIQNYSIYHRDGYLFSYLEYTGDNWDEDMKKMAADSTTQAWWKLSDPCQEPVPSAGEGEWWADMEEVYHLD